MYGCAPVQPATADKLKKKKSKAPAASGEEQPVDDAAAYQDPRLSSWAMAGAPGTTPVPVVPVTAPVAASGGAFCLSATCGAPLKPGAKFCGKCGMKQV